MSVSTIVFFVIGVLVAGAAMAASIRGVARDGYGSAPERRL